MKKPHLLLWFKSLGSAYSAADLAVRQGARLLELFPFGSKAHLFLELGSPFSTTKFTESLKEKPERSKELNLSESVLQAYLSLTNPPLEDDLVTVESGFLGDIFEASQAAVESGLNILDLRFTRDSQAASYALLTGKNSACGQFLKKLPHGVTAYQISNPAEALRDFFPRPPST